MCECSKGISIVALADQPPKKQQQQHLVFLHNPAYGTITLSYPVKSNKCRCIKNPHSRDMTHAV